MEKKEVLAALYIERRRSWKLKRRSEIEGEGEETVGGGLL